MRQGEITPKGEWQGSATGGVIAPEPILLPDPARRFLSTAERLERLAPGHPMEAWLLFMAGVSHAQHVAATAPLAIAPPDALMVDRSVDGRIPPLAADGHARAPAWREGLTLLLDALDRGRCPPPAEALIDWLRAADPDIIEQLAADFLSGTVEAEAAGLAMFIAAGLQVYFTRMAGALEPSELRLLPERGLCPCCGSLPVGGLVTATGRTPGTRYLYCSLCSTAWNHVRTICITCGNTKGLELQSIEGGSGAVVGETCPSCSTYAKMLYQARDTRVDPYADDLASLGLDLMLAEEGWQRHAPNPLVLGG